MPEKLYKKAGLLKQTSLLVKKNFKVILGRPGFLFSHVFTTMLVCGVILLINALTRYSYENEPSMIYPVNEVDNIQMCEFSDNCKSLGYIIIVSSLKNFKIFIILREMKQIGPITLYHTLLRKVDQLLRKIFLRFTRETMSLKLSLILKIRTISNSQLLSCFALQGKHLK